LPDAQHTRIVLVLEATAVVERPVEIHVPLRL
jgi:hypothetical protein